MKLNFWNKSNDKTTVGKGFLVNLINRAFRPRQMYEASKDDPLVKHAEIRAQDTETQQMFYGYKRIQAYADSENLYNNNNAGSTIDICIRLTVGESGGVPQFTGDNAKENQDRFDAWKKKCGFYEDENYIDMLKLILHSVKIKGDCLILLDPVLTGGKLRVFDADQITPISPADFEKWCTDVGGFDGDSVPENRWRQVEGAVVNTQGRCIGWFVTMKRNRASVALADAAFIPMGVGIRVSSRKILTQYRGEPILLPNLPITKSTHDLMGSEVQGAKNASELSLAVIEGEDKVGDQAAALLNGLSNEKATEGTGITADQLKEIREKTQGGNTFEALAGKSAIGRFPHGTQIQSLDNANRPSVSIQEWMNNLSDMNGHRYGVMSCLARGHSEHSYSAGQMELAISWVTLEEDQKMLERYVVDYICAIMFPGATYIVKWPKAFDIDPMKSEQTNRLKLQNGGMTFREYLGPRYLEKFDQMAYEKKELEKRNLNNLSIFQSNAGNQLDTPKEPSENEERKEN